MIEPTSDCISPSRWPLLDVAHLFHRYGDMVRKGKVLMEEYRLSVCFARSDLQESKRFWYTVLLIEIGESKDLFPLPLDAIHSSFSLQKCIIVSRYCLLPEKVSWCLGFHWMSLYSLGVLCISVAEIKTESSCGVKIGQAMPMTMVGSYTAL
jgi:hypothetical protein